MRTDRTVNVECIVARMEPEDLATDRIDPRRPRLRRCWALFVACAAAGACAPAPPDAGRDANAPAGPTRVVVLAPAAAEMLESLERIDRVVAIGEYGPWPTAIRDLPVVGGYATPNVERILELRADLVLTAASDAAADAHRRLAALGVDVLALDTSTLDGVFASLDLVGTAFDVEPAARRVADEMRTELQEIAARARDLPRRRVLFVVGRDPLYVAGPGSHVDELIRIAGGENVAADAAATYAQFSLETILERAPEVIIDTSDNRPGAPRGRQAGPWGEWAFLPAVRDDRVWLVEPGRLVIPGMRLPEMARLTAHLVHPESFDSAATTER